MVRAAATAILFILMVILITMIIFPPNISCIGEKYLHIYNIYL